MADLFDRLTNQPIRSAAPGNLPRVDFAAGREAARTSQTLANAMDRISNYAFESAKRSQTIEGSRAGAADPKGTLLSLEDRDPSSFSFRESAAYASAVEGLSAQVEVEAKKTMGEIMLDSTQKGENPQQLGERLDMAVIGFSDSLALLDPGTAQKLQLTLDNYRNAQYLNFSEDYIKEQRRASRAAGAINLDVMNQSLENFARSPMAPAAMDKMLNDQLDSMGAYLKGQGFTDEEIAAERLRSQKRAVVARARGEFERLESPEAQLQFVEDFRKDIGKGKGLARGMADSTAETLANSFETLAKSARSALNGEITNLKADIKLEVTSVVTAGGVPGQQVVDKLRSRVTALEEQGGDKEKIAELKDLLTTAEGNIEYFQGIQGYNIEQLEAEEQRLMEVKDMGATPDDILRLKVVKSRLSSMETAAREQNLVWGAAAKTVGKSIESLEKVVQRFDQIREEDLGAVDEAINQLEAEGAPENMIGALRSEVEMLKKMSEVYNDVADDSTMTLEDKIAVINQQVGGLSPAQSDLLDDMKKRLTSMRTALKDDPMSWANGAGVVTLKVDVVETVLGGDANAINEAVQSRVEHANKVASHYGIPRQILTKSEATALSTALSEAPIEAQAGLLEKVVGAFGPNALDVMKQISKDAPELAHIGGLMVSGATPDIIDAAMRGKVIKDGTEERALGEMTDQRTARVRIMDGVSGGSEAMIRTSDRLIAVADLIYLGRGGSAGGAFDHRLYERALQEAAGMRILGDEEFGGFTTYNKRNILLPSNIKRDGGVDEIFDNMNTVDDVIALAVTQNDRGEIVPYDQPPYGFGNDQDIPLSVIKKSYLISVGDGLYKLGYKGNTLFGPNNQPYLIDLKRAGG